MSETQEPPFNPEDYLSEDSELIIAPKMPDEEIQEASLEEFLQACEEKSIPPIIGPPSTLNFEGIEEKPPSKSPPRNETKIDQRKLAFYIREIIEAVGIDFDEFVNNYLK